MSRVHRLFFIKVLGIVFFIFLFILSKCEISLSVIFGQQLWIPSLNVILGSFVTTRMSHQSAPEVILEGLYTPGMFHYFSRFSPFVDNLSARSLYIAL